MFDLQTFAQTGHSQKVSFVYTHTSVFILMTTERERKLTWEMEEIPVKLDEVKI
jgi:hypothetical protein